jgi:hypothetical protein
MCMCARPYGRAGQCGFGWWGVTHRWPDEHQTTLSLKRKGSQLVEKLRTICDADEGKLMQAGRTTKSEQDDQGRGREPKLLHRPASHVKGLPDQHRPLHRLFGDDRQPKGLGEGRRPILPDC